MSALSVASLLLVAALATSHAGDSLSQVERWPDVIGQAKRHGIDDYPAVAQRAARNDAQALRVLFRFTRHMDGAAADSHCKVLRLVLEQLGDQRFSAALRRERSSLRSQVMQAIDFAYRRPWRKSFPRTYALGSHDTSMLRGH